jgi:hypothetical protein
MTVVDTFRQKYYIFDKNIDKFRQIIYNFKCGKILVGKPLMRLPTEFMVTQLFLHRVDMPGAFSFDGIGVCHRLFVINTSLGV